MYEAQGYVEQAPLGPRILIVLTKHNEVYGGTTHGDSGVKGFEPGLCIHKFVIVVIKRIRRSVSAGSYYKAYL